MFMIRVASAQIMRGLSITGKRSLLDSVRKIYWFFFLF